MKKVEHKTYTIVKYVLDNGKFIYHGQVGGVFTSKFDAEDYAKTLDKSFKYDVQPFLNTTIHPKKKISDVINELEHIMNEKGDVEVNDVIVSIPKK